jgi:hypothetical protein
MDYEVQNLQYSPNMIKVIRRKTDKYLNFTGEKKSIGDLINNGTSEGLNPRKKVPGCAVDSCPGQDQVHMVIKHLVT